MANAGSDSRGSGAHTADVGYNGGSVVQGTTTAVARARTHKATVEQMHWWLSRGVRAAEETAGATGAVTRARDTKVLV